MLKQDPDQVAQGSGGNSTQPAPPPPPQPSQQPQQVAVAPQMPPVPAHYPTTDFYTPPANFLNTYWPAADATASQYAAFYHQQAQQQAQMNAQATSSYYAQAVVNAANATSPVRASPSKRKSSDSSPGSRRHKKSEFNVAFFYIFFIYIDIGLHGAFTVHFTCIFFTI